MSQISRGKTKKELEQLLQDSEARNQSCRKVLNDAEAELKRWKPKDVTYRLTITESVFNHMTYDRIQIKLKALIDAGVIFFNVEQEQ